MKLKKFLKMYPVQMDREKTGFLEWTCTLKRGGNEIEVTMPSLFRPSIREVFRELTQDAGVVEVMDGSFDVFLSLQTHYETREEIRRRWDPMHAKWQALSSLFEDRRELETLLKRVKV